MKFCILTSKSSWFYRNKKNEIKKIFKKNIKIFNSPKKVTLDNELCFVISYYKIIPKKYFKKNIKFLVNHESNLPENRGFSPLYWQILQGKTKIVSTLFSPDSNKVDKGKIILKKKYIYNKYLLFDEIKSKQFYYAIDMIKSYLRKKKNKIPQPKKTNFLKKRNKDDSKLNINKSLKAQFNLLRICDNKKFPAFFEINNKKYIVKIFKE